MAIINQEGIVNTIVEASSDDACNISLHGQAFNSFMKNRVQNLPELGFNCRGEGVELCYGSTEGFPAIMRAYKSLKESISAEEFGSRIAHALQAVVEPYPTGGHNLLYPHFLLHGIAQNSVDAVVEKILENARILSESRSARERLSNSFGQGRSILDDRFYLILVNGFGDDFDALSLQLFKSKEEPLYKNDMLFAKVGFHVDTPNKTAYICNLQGRSPSRSEDKNSHRRELKHGRAYAQFANETGCDPREFVLNQLFQFLKVNDIKAVRAIRPAEHLSNIGNHHGFMGRYDSILAKAGMEQENQIYRSINIS